MLKNKQLSTKAICACLYHSCLYLYWLFFKLALFCGLASNFIPTNIQNVGILKNIDQKIKPSIKKTPYWLVLLLSCWMVFFLLLCEKKSSTRSFILISFLFFIWNITAICKNKITTYSEPELILKELESSQLSSFTLNLTDISNFTAKYRWKVFSKWRQKLLFIA